MAKALQDGRLLDLPLSMTFYKLLLGQVARLLNQFILLRSFYYTLSKTDDDGRLNRSGISFFLVL